MPALVVLSAVAALVFGEAAVFLGFVVPGETAVLLAGFLASTGRVSVVALAIVVVVAAIVGDSVGYEVGKRCGPRLLRTRLFGRYEDRVDRARALPRRTRRLRDLRRPVHRVPARRHAGPRRASAACATAASWPTTPRAALVWGVGCVVAGYVAGRRTSRSRSYLGQGGAVAAAVFVVVALVVWRVARRRAGRPGDDVADGGRETAQHGR